jgi:FkbM family methyltransferase
MPVLRRRNECPRQGILVLDVLHNGIRVGGCDFMDFDRGDEKMNFVNQILESTGIRLVRADTLKGLQKRISTQDAAFISSLPFEHIPAVLNNWDKAKAQFGQDLFALAMLGFKRDGYFVDFGATNGLEGSNSWLMENRFGWRGIVAEPARIWHEDLRKNRICHIETRCVYSKSGETVEFSECASPALSTIRGYADGDYMRTKRSRSSTYKVETMSLNDMLGTYGAPAHIDYLSIDTEGSEFEILQELDFEHYSFGVITCEHNHTPMREKIFRLLEAEGYRRVLEQHSDVDDWFVRDAQK